MLNLVDEYKLIFVEKRGKAWNSPKSFCLYCSFLYICFEVCQKTKSNLLRDWIFGQSFRMPNLMNDYKIIFLGKRKKRLNSSKAFSLYWSFLPILEFSSTEFSGSWNIGSRLYNGKVGRWIQNYFSSKMRETLELLKSFVPILESLH